MKMVLHIKRTLSIINSVLPVHHNDAQERELSSQERRKGFLSLLGQQVSHTYRLRESEATLETAKSNYSKYLLPLMQSHKGFCPKLRRN
jgi:hypothetical protein